MAKKDPDVQKTHPGENALTPLMQQYRDIKAGYPGMILFFRLGDFYEMFGDDALKASKLLEVVLTQRQGVPMCGVPHHSVNAYLKKLVKAGEKVAICEQLEEPGAGRGIVRRGVVRVITPGTILEENLLDAKENNFLMAILPSGDYHSFGIAYIDISTGEFACTEAEADKVNDEVFRLAPGEIVVPANEKGNPFFAALERENGAGMSPLEDWFFSYDEAEGRIRRTFRLQSLKPFGLEGKDLAAGAAGAVLAYLEKTHLGRLPPFSSLRHYSPAQYLLLDATALRNLEIVESVSSGGRENSLIEAVDATRTPMGARLLRRWLLQPLVSAAGITARQNAVEYFVENGISRRTLREQLNGVADLERILSRLASGVAGPREVVGLKNSLQRLPDIKDSLVASDTLLASPETVAALSSGLAVPEETIRLISSAINDEPPASLKDGGVIREGFDAELDGLRHLSRDAKELLSRMESQERRATGIATLKIGYTSVFGYYLEVTKANLPNVPPHYLRKQTLTGAERFITPELKSFEEKILSAEEKRLRLEEELFKKVRERILAFAGSLKELAARIAELDVYASFAETAVLHRYVRPRIDESFDLSIKDGRHPVIEQKLKSGSFIANDTFLNGDSDQIVLLTGPNMAGKSTYLRQAALIVVLAQAGSFVPAAEARVGIVDRIFTRIGAGDNLAGGESTFMVEMHETANILNQNTPRSLIILDEVGRGTSTYDGISIAWATVEHLSSRRADGRGPKVLFATHYFELTDLALRLAGVKNYNVAVKEWQGDVVFLHKIVPGAADRSYGIHVAQLAGLPGDVIRRAYRILADLEKKAAEELPDQGRSGQPDLFGAGDPSPSLSSRILIELEKLDPNRITPLDAFQLVLEWKKKTEKPAVP